MDGGVHEAEGDAGMRLREERTTNTVGEPPLLHSEWRRGPGRGGALLSHPQACQLQPRAYPPRMDSTRAARRRLYNPSELGQFSRNHRQDNLLRIDS